MVGKRTVAAPGQQPEHRPGAGAAAQVPVEDTVEQPTAGMDNTVHTPADRGHNQHTAGSIADIVADTIDL